MVAVIKTSHSVQRILNYNELKVKEEKAECINAVNFPLELDKLNFILKLNRFNKLASLNENVKRNAVHISLNFDPSENYSKEKLNEIAEMYMEKIGFGKQPYLVYQHHDAGQHHCHIVKNHLQRDGTRIDLHLLGIRKSESARKEIEQIFGLVKAEGRKPAYEFSLKPIKLKVEYGKAESRKAINAVLNKVLFDYKYSSLPELNAVLNLYNVHADRGTEESRVFKNNGLFYRILNKDSKPVGVPIKASDFYSKPTLKFLEERFKVNETKKSSDKSRIKNTIQMAFIKETNLSLDRFIKQMEKEGIHAVLRKSETGFVYGITYVDHVTKNVFNGSSLGKEYSAKAIIERCENLSSQERSLQISEKLNKFFLENSPKMTLDLESITKLT